MKRPALAWGIRGVALALFLLSLAGTAYGFLSLLVLPGTELIPERPSLGDVLTTSLVFFMFPAVGLLVAWHRPSHPIGWLFLFTGLSVTASVVAAEYTDRAVYAGASHAAVEIVAWLGGWSWVVSAALVLTFGVLLFPSGHTSGSRGRLLAWASALAIGATLLAQSTRPGPLEGYEHVPLLNPFGIGGPIADLLAPVAEAGLFIILALGLASIASLVVRFRRAVGAERQQMKWFLYPVGLLLTSLVIAASTQSDVAWLGAILGLGLVPVGAGIGILRHRLFDIDLVINRTLVYGTLSVVLGAVYIGLVLGLQALVTPLLGTDTIAVALSTLAVAALFRPARRRVQRAVDRRFYRSRYDAQRTLEAFAARLREQIDRERLAESLREATVATLNPRAASVWLRDR